MDVFGMTPGEILDLAERRLNASVATLENRQALMIVRRAYLYLYDPEWYGNEPKGSSSVDHYFALHPEGRLGR